MDNSQTAKDICTKYNSPYTPVDSMNIVGVAENVASGLQPLNALRHPVSENVSGWYIWAGEEYSDSPDFFKPMHVEHLLQLRPEIEMYLALEPSWRVLLDKNRDYVDVWKDEKLLDV